VNFRHQSVRWYWLVRWYYFELIGGEAACAFRTSPGTYMIKTAYYSDPNFKWSKSPGIKLVVVRDTKPPPRIPHRQ
jgi:hypothetical protein